ncbi:MAG: glutathione peroxidase [Phycisphaerales bacterium]|nr:glutathione peroxidase [Phycisphaerales bacterium]
MKHTLAIIAICGFCVAARADESASAKSSAKEVKSVLDFEVKTIDGETVKLDKYRGDVCLIVNVASQCGLTDGNYKALEPLYKKYHDQGFRVLAFPANNFGAQEPGTNDEIKKFCTNKYNVTFDLFDKVSVKGDDICPLYDYLTHHPDKEIAGDVLWNFQKYLVDREGNVIAKFDPRTSPNDEKLVAELAKALAEPKPETKDADK